MRLAVITERAAVVTNGTSVIARPVEGLGEVFPLFPLLSGVMLLLPPSSETVLSSVLPVSAGLFGAAAAVVSAGSFGAAAAVAVVSAGSSLNNEPCKCQ